MRSHPLTGEAPKPRWQRYKMLTEVSEEQRTMYEKA